MSITCIMEVNHAVGNENHQTKLFSSSILCMKNIIDIKKINIERKAPQIVREPLFYLTVIYSSFCINHCDYSGAFQKHLCALKAKSS